MAFLATTTSLSARTEDLPRRPSVETSASVMSGYSAFQDQLALSFVYHGALLGGRIGQRVVWDSSLVTWDLALEASLHGSHGMPAIGTELRPWDAAYLHRFRVRSSDLWLGVGASGSYRLWLNPLLNSGHFYWFSHYSLDLRASLPFSLWARDFRVDVAVAALSLVSRPDPYPDPYFYSWKFTDIVADAHDNLRLASLNHVRKLDIVGHWLLRDKSWAPMVRCSYEAYMPEPRLHVLDYALGVTWR